MVAKTSQFVDVTPALPGGFVQQRHNVRGGDCFSACVSMLTSIDLDLLPVLPPALHVTNPDSEGWSHIMADDDTWMAWEELLADNGFRLAINNNPDGPYIWAIYDPSTYYGHAVVVVAGYVVDPTYGVGYTTEDYLNSGLVEMTKLTVTPL